MKTLQKILKTSTIYLLMTGVIIAIGLLSYCGMLAIYPSLVKAWAAFAFAGLVEGEVFKQNIERGVENIKLLGKEGLPILITQSLDKVIAAQKDSIAASDGFLKE